MYCVVNSASNIGASDVIAAFASERRVANVPCAVMGMTPLMVFRMWAARKLMSRKIEHMLSVVVRKQLVVANKLNSELEKSCQQNIKNHQEIENLKEMLRILKETEEYLNAT